MRRNLMLSAMLPLLLMASTPPAIAQSQGTPPTPKRRTKAEKKAAKRARNAGVATVAPGWSEESLREGQQLGDELVAESVAVIERALDGLTDKDVSLSLGVVKRALGVTEVPRG